MVSSFDSDAASAVLRRTLDRAEREHESSSFVRSAIVASLLLVLLFVVLTHLHRAAYIWPRISSISSDLDRLYDPDENGVDTDTSRKNFAMRVRNNIGVGIDSLPIVKFDATDTSSRENTDIETLLRRRRECLSFGSFVSDLDEYTDCATFCGVQDGVRYRYYDKLGQLLNGRQARVGGYCMPTDAALCNSNTSITVYGKGEWRCLPQSRAFGGVGGNTIVACNGDLLDRATGKIWHGYIDSSLVFDSVDEKLPSDTHEFRFVCPTRIRDVRDNKSIQAPFDRLLLLNNTCASLIPHADDSIRPDFRNNRCLCGLTAVYSERFGTCVPRNLENATMNDVFDRQTLETVISIRSGSIDDGGAHTGDVCLEPWMTISQARALSKLAGVELLPMCGVEKDSSVDGSANVATVRTRVLAFDRPIPSPAAMLLSAPSLTQDVLVKQSGLPRSSITASATVSQSAKLL